MEKDMRGIQLQFNPSQKLRLKTAMESLSSNVNFDDIITISDSIPVKFEDKILKGRGTADLGGEIVSTLCGTVERVNKLVYVRPLSSRYKPEVGDIVIGRIVEVAQKHWKLDINCNQNAYLMISAVNMLDGVQRRRTPGDELNMRCIFEETDYICAEVDIPHGDIHLQTRSQKHGKLRSGQLLTVAPYLVKRQKQHFHHLEQYGIDLIIGCNGFIWVGEHFEIRDDMVEDQEVNQSDPQVLVPNKILVSLEEQEKDYMPLETRKYICRAANAVRVLSTLGFIITLEVIKGVIDLSISTNLDINDMLGSEFCVMVAEKETERRNTKLG